ncbi:GNAT family N-acetyltransferase [Niveibacterium sp. 24ML]|uniref:GNAT family N-acetyltransferase n=1 Tax=Niveibacterium sp. 24ML TaxID=2985512 RepID=UPI00226D88FE|nr:GNAT family N-acetyltransferase [Niveibacterium sp. 24ML]MCX9154582.1 GNAT family N-acetyltransferase [Niveibacterium sp. 24ML]
MSVRVAEPGDAPAIARLYSQLLGSDRVSVTPARLSQLKDDPATRLLVSVNDTGDVIATALLCFCADAMFNDQPFAVVENIVVDEANRSAGIGTYLLSEIERICLERDCSKIMLLSSATRTAAHRFFERHGFASATKRGFVKYRREFAASAHDPLKEGLNK